MLVELCSHLELVIGNTYFRNEGINMFTWQRVDNGRLIERAMMDYVLVEKSALSRLVDVHVARGAGGGVADNFLVVANVKGFFLVGFKRRKEQVQCKKVTKVSELNKRVKEQEYVD